MTDWIVAKLNWFEEKEELNNLQYKGFFFWNYMREHVYDQILLSINSIPTRSWDNKPTKLNDYLILGKKLFSCLGSGNILHADKADILIYDHSRKVPDEDGHLFSIYTKDWLKDYEKKYIVIDAFDKRFVTNTKKKQYYSDCVILFLSKIKAIFHSKKDVYTCLNGFKDVLLKLEQLFEISLNKEYLINTCKRLYLSYKGKRKLFLSVIKRVSPKCVVEVVHYHPDKMIMTECCKELSIPVIELQHGTIGKTHFCYNYGSIKDVKQFPNFIFLFANLWGSNASFPIDRKNLRAVGFPFLDAKVTNTHKKFDQISILFVSQLTYGKQLISFALKLDEQLRNKGFKFNIVYRLHPGERSLWKSIYPELLSLPETMVVDDSSNSIYSLFQECNVQIGVDSTAIIEGVAFGLKTYILPYQGYQNLMMIVDNNCGKLVNSVDEIVKDCNEIDSCAINSELFWKSDATNNLRKEIEKIIANK